VAKTHEHVYSTMNNRLKDMMRDVEIQIFTKAVYENMTTIIKTLLYFGSTNFTRFSPSSKH